MGSGSRDVNAWRADVSVRRGSGAPDADGPGACLSQPLGVGVDSLVFIHLIPRIDHKIRMVINRLNHHYLDLRISTTTGALLTLVLMDIYITLMI